MINTTKILIFGLIRTYKRQNPNIKDFINISKLFFQRLRARGHATEEFNQHFNDALKRLNNTNFLPTPSPKPKPKITSTSNNLFFHLQYHLKASQETSSNKHTRSFVKTTHLPQKQQMIMRKASTTC